MEHSQSIDALRLSVLQTLMNTQNTNLLKRTLELIQEEAKTDQVVGYQPNGSPIDLTQLEKSVAESRKEIEKGDFVTIDELEEESKTWV